MKKSFLKQLWVAFKIWVIALAANTFGGSIYLSGDLDTELMQAGLVFGCIFSFPILVILVIIIHHCVSRRKNGLDIFQYVLLSGLTLTIFSSLFFVALIGAPPGLLFISVLAAVVGIGLQYNALFKLANYQDEFEKFLS